MICAALSGASKDDVLFGTDPAQFKCAKVRAIAAGEYRPKDVAKISGSGYVIDCLEASAWCFLKTYNFLDAVLMAVNLGDDADTTGAVCGQLAGAFYGEDGIPAEWRARLVMAAEIRLLADQLGAKN
jgi:ADP-ribosyl-[dinitrogen reductase] hydrolase